MSFAQNLDGEMHIYGRSQTNSLILASRQINSQCPKFIGKVKCSRISWCPALDFQVALYKFQE